MVSELSVNNNFILYIYFLLKQLLYKMKKNTYLLTLLLLFSFQEIFGQTTFEMSEELIFDFSRSKLEVSDFAKSIRSSKRTGGGKIILNYIDSHSVSEELIASLDVAADIWQYYLPYGDSLRVDVCFEDNLDSDISLSVIYKLHKGLAYPLPLLRRMFSEELNEKYDAKIHINTSTEWSFGIGDENAYAPKNLTLAFMQCICKCLGFGSSLKEVNNRVDIGWEMNPTIFDSYIINDLGDKLTDYISDEPGLGDFSTGKYGNVYFSSGDVKAELYAPSVFENNSSLRYLQNDISLMRYCNDDNVSQDLVIDELTLDVLSELGWSFSSESEFAIVSDDIDSTGITSAYMPHEFYILSDGEGFTEPNWQLVLTLADGSSTTVCSSDNSSFTIPAISDPDLYEHTVDGDIRGVIIFEGVSRGKTFTLTYPIIFEIKPRIISANVISSSVNIDNPNYFDAIVEIRYEGSHYINAFVEEEHNPYLISYYSSTPYYSRIHLTNIASWGGAWFDITIRNEYGSDNYVLDLSNSVTGIDIDRNDNDETSRIEIYDIQGRFVGICNEISQSNLPKGIYILKFFDKKNICKKILKQYID